MNLHTPQRGLTWILIYILLSHRGIERSRFKLFPRQIKKAGGVTSTLGDLRTTIYLCCFFFKKKIWGWGRGKELGDRLHYRHTAFCKGILFCNWPQAFERRTNLSRIFQLGSPPKKLRYLHRIVQSQHKPRTGREEY